MKLQLPERLKDFFFPSLMLFRKQLHNSLTYKKPTKNLEISSIILDIAKLDTIEKVNPQNNANRNTFRRPHVSDLVMEENCKYFARTLPVQHLHKSPKMRC